MNDRLMASVINESRDDIDGMKFLPMTKIQTSMGLENHGGVITESSKSQIYSLNLENFSFVVHLPLLAVDQLEKSVLARRAENNDKSAR